MTGKTHVAGGTAMALGSFLLLDKCNLLLPDINNAVQLGIILPYAIWASNIPDLDQRNPNRVETNPVNTVIADVFRILRAGHRSMKSHVIPCLLMGVLLCLTVIGKIFTSVNATTCSILALMELGLFIGLFSHMILDMCTKDGLTILDKRVAFVPKADIFCTGSLYEKWFHKICYVISCLLLILIIIL